MLGSGDRTSAAAKLARGNLLEAGNIEAAS
jgi:hypothetical protein